MAEDTQEVPQETPQETPIVQQGETNVEQLNEGKQVSNDGDTKPSIKINVKPGLDADGNVVPPEVKQDETPEVEKPQETPEATDLNATMEEHQKVASEINDTLKEAGFDPTSLAKEWDENGGKLTEETVKSLEDKGYSRELQEAVIEGQQAKVAKMQTSLFEAAGGTEEAYNDVWNWAGENLDASEKARINEFYEKGDLAGIRNSIFSIKYRMGESQGTPKPAPVATVPQGSPSPAGTGIATFRNAEEQREAFSDPKYQKSENYRQEVNARLLATMRAKGK